MKTTNKARKGKKATMRSRMARFARVFWRKIKNAAKSVAARAKKVGHKINSAGNFAPLPDDTSKPSVARRVARVVASIPKFVGMVAHYAVKVVTATITTVVGIAALLVTFAMHVIQHGLQALVMLLSTPYYYAVSTEYAKENWKELWDQFVAPFRAIRVGFNVVFGDGKALDDFIEAELDEEETDEVFVAVVHEVPTEDITFVDGVLVLPEEEPEPEAKPDIKSVKGKGRPTPKRHTPRNPYPFGPGLADTA